MNQQAKQWIDYWNSKFPSLLGTIRESKYMFYEQLGNKNNYRSLHNCLVRNLVKDILEPAEAKIFIFEGDRALASLMYKFKGESSSSD